jgi:hypothetical protein
VGAGLQALLPQRSPPETRESMNFDWRFAPQCCAWQSVRWRRRVRRRLFRAVHVSVKLGTTGMLPLPLAQASEVSASSCEGQHKHREEPSARRRPFADGPATGNRPRRPSMRYALRNTVPYRRWSFALSPSSAHCSRPKMRANPSFNLTFSGLRPPNAS